MLVRGIAAGLGAPPDAVSSPTFVLLHEYRGRLPLAHLDLYRLGSRKEAETIGLEDYLSGATVVAVEWAERWTAAPVESWVVRMRHEGDDRRGIVIEESTA